MSRQKLSINHLLILVIGVLILILVIQQESNQQALAFPGPLRPPIPTTGRPPVGRPLKSPTLTRPPSLPLRVPTIRPITPPNFIRITGPAAHSLQYFNKIADKGLISLIEDFAINPSKYLTKEALGNPRLVTQTKVDRDGNPLGYTKLFYRPLNLDPLSQWMFVIKVDPKTNILSIMEVNEMSHTAVFPQKPSFLVDFEMNALQAQSKAIGSPKANPPLSILTYSRTLAEQIDLLGMKLGRPSGLESHISSSLPVGMDGSYVGLDSYMKNLYSISPSTIKGPKDLLTISDSLALQAENIYKLHDALIEKGSLEIKVEGDTYTYAFKGNKFTISYEIDGKTITQTAPDAHGYFRAMKTNLEKAAKAFKDLASSEKLPQLINDHQLKL